MKLQNENSSMFFDKNTLDSEVQNSIDKLKLNIHKTTKMFTESRVAVDRDSYHAMTRFLVPETKMDFILYSYIFQNALKAEKLSAGSAYCSILTSIAFFETLSKHPDFFKLNDYQVVEDYQRREQEVYSKISNLSNPFTKEKLKEVISESIGEDEQLANVVLEAISLTGIDGVINVEDSYNENYSVELRDGYRFPATIYKSFIGAFGSWEYPDVKIMLVDGILEQVSELDKILRKAFETKIPMVIAAQGFSEEILSTLKVNFDSKRLNVIPVVIGGDFESLNILNDVSVVSGTRVISTLNGDLIQFANYDDFEIVDYVVCNELGLQIMNPKKNSDVAQQINSLIKRRNDQKASSVFDIGELFDKRISNLLCHTVTINLPNVSEAQSEGIRTKIDVALRTVKSLVSYGYFNKSDLNALKFEQEINDPIVQSINNSIEMMKTTSIKKNKFPSLSLVMSIHLAGRAALQFMRSSGIVATH